MLPHEGDDQHQATSAESEGPGYDVSKRCDQQLAFRELLSPLELATLHQLESDSKAEDPFLLCCYRLASAMVCWDVYRCLGYSVDMRKISRALDDDVRDTMIRWAHLETGAIDETVRDIVLSEYSRVLNAMMDHLTRLKRQSDLPDSWDNRLVSMVDYLANPASSLSDN